MLIADYNLDVLLHFDLAVRSIRSLAWSFCFLCSSCVGICYCR